MVLLFHKNKVYLADPLGSSIQNYQLLHCRLVKFYNGVTQRLKLKPNQNENSKLFGLLCIYVEHVMFVFAFSLRLNMNDNDLLRFVIHMH